VIAYNRAPTPVLTLCEVRVVHIIGARHVTKVLGAIPLYIR
jgi:hypothetical protein